MDDKIVNISVVKEGKEKLKREIEQLFERLNELNTEKFFIEKEIELIDYLIKTAKDRNKFDMNVLHKHLKAFDEE